MGTQTSAEPGGGVIPNRVAAPAVQTADALPLQRRRLGLPRVQELGLLVVIFVLAAILVIYGRIDARGGTNTFLNAQNLIDQVATVMAVYAIMAVGETVVIITGGIDISVGSIFALSAMVCADVLQRMNPEAPAWKTIPVA